MKNINKFEGPASSVVLAKDGFATSALIGIIAGIIILGGAIYFATSNSAPETGDSEKVIENSDAMMDSEKDGDAMMGDGDKMEGDGAMMDENGAMMEYKGQVLAGTEAKLLDFNKTDFDEALKTDNLIILYFYADWCPICRAEFPKMQSAFNELKTNKVVAFRVNYKDDFTDKDEESLAKEHGIAYQHTKVFIQNNKRVLKAPDSWEKDRYLTEINNLPISN